MMYLAKFPIDVSLPGSIGSPQKTWKLECRQVPSFSMNSSGIRPSFSNSRKIFCLKSSSSLSQSNAGARANSLAGGVAHDLNNVLGIVVGYLPGGFDQGFKPSFFSQ